MSTWDAPAAHCPQLRGAGRHTGATASAVERKTPSPTESGSPKVQPAICILLTPVSFETWRLASAGNHLALDDSVWGGLSSGLRQTTAPSASQILRLDYKGCSVTQNHLLSFSFLISVPCFSLSQERSLPFQLGCSVSAEQCVSQGSIQQTPSDLFKADL